MKKLLISAYAALMLTGMFFVPAPAQAQDAPGPGYHFVVPCTGKAVAGSGGERLCTFVDMMTLVNRAINLMLYIAMVLAVISFIYAGFKLLFSGGNEEAVGAAKHIFWSVVVGLIFAYGAWLIVHFILVTLGVNEGYSLLS